MSSNSNKKTIKYAAFISTLSLTLIVVQSASIAEPINGGNYSLQSSSSQSNTRYTYPSLDGLESGNQINLFSIKSIKEQLDSKPELKTPEEVEVLETTVEEPVAPVQPQESQEAYLSRIVAELGITVPVYLVPFCEGWTTALGCFDIKGNFIEITHLGMSEGEASLRCTLKHEARHAWQLASGFMYTLQGESEEAWLARLEHDAAVNGCD
jgi:hypothetical protein